MVTLKTLPLPGVGTHFDAAAQGLGQMLADAKAQAGAAELSRGGTVDLGEGLEETLELLFVHADARVDHVKTEARRAALVREPDDEANFALVGELDRVAQRD